MNEASSTHSISELNLYQDCRRAHSYRYRLRMFQPSGESAVVGTAVHKGLEYAALSLMSDGSYDVEHCLTVAQGNATEAGVTSSHDRIESAVRAGLEFLDDLLADGHRILSAEKFFTYQFDTWSTKGQIDLITERDGCVHVFDWKVKVNGKMPTATGGIIDPQTTSYAYQVMRDLGVDEVTAGPVFLRAAPYRYGSRKDGKLSLTETTCDFRAYKRLIAKFPDLAIDEEKARNRFGKWCRSDAQLLTKFHAEHVLAQLAGVAREIDQGLEPFPNYRPQRCTWCDYSDICVAHTLTGHVDTSRFDGIESSP